MPAAKLKDEHKRFMVRLFARKYSPQEAADELKERFGIEITRGGAQRYNPECVSGSELKGDLRKVFDKERAAYVKGSEGVPIADKTTRLRRLEGLYHRNLGRGNTLQAAAVLKQAAEETGQAGADGTFPFKVYFGFDVSQV